MNVVKKNILVFPCGSEIGLEIYRSLSYSTHFKLYGASSVDDHGQFMYANYIGNMPHISDSTFADRLCAILDKYKIDFIFPAHDDVVLKLAQLASEGDIPVPVLTSSLDACETARSKSRTYELFKGTVIIPKMYNELSDITEDDLPVFLKPNIGQGSKGVHLARTKAEISFYVSQDPSLLMLEYLPGKEYTVDCFTDKSGVLLFCEGRERKRVMNGISVSSVHVKDVRFRQIAQKINETLTLKGVWFFQVKENQRGDLALMEIAPRVAGTMGLTRCIGVNLPLLSLFDAMGVGISIMQNEYNLVIDRALQSSYKHNFRYRHVYIDLDDLLIFEGKVNPYIVAFLYQCFNKAVKLHILTRHKADLAATLKAYRLDGLFDEVLHVTDGKEKARYVKEKDAIFIDDSFVERQKVHDQCAVPVFDAHMVESLMETF